MKNPDKVRRDDMIEMLTAFDKAFAVRAEKWGAEAIAHNTTVVISPQQAERDAQRVRECMIRMDELRAVRELIRGTIKTCQEQNFKPQGESNE